MLYAFGSRTIVFGFAHGVEQDLLHIVEFLRLVTVTALSATVHQTYTYECGHLLAQGTAKGFQ